MPFERYLRDDHTSSNTNHDYYHDRRNVVDDAAHDYTRSFPSETTRYDPHAVHFQIPQFMLNGPPILAPGGGAEVLPAGILEGSPDSLTSSWLTNNGFASFHSALISRQIASRTTANTASFRSLSPDASQRLPPSFLPRFTASVDPRQQLLPQPPSPFKVAPNYVPNTASTSPSASTANVTPYVPSNAILSEPTSSASVTIPSPLGLPIYSASGFDVLSILSRVVNRPNPTIQLGPVDLSCSFVIVDVRRHDSPIVYASPMFCHLTGYSDQEVLGRNCRFLQSPNGRVTKGEPRRFASPEAVSHMQKLLSSSKECQTTLVNYRKGGQAFINLVTVIPLRGGIHNTPEEADDVVYHVGFQVDLTEQPTWILDKLRDGSYHSGNNNSWETSNLFIDGGLSLGHSFSQLAHAQNMATIGTKGGRHGQMMSIAVSKELRNLIADTTFTDSVSISTGANISGPTSSSSGPGQGSSTTTPLTALVSPPSSSSSTSRVSASSNAKTGSTPVSLSPSLSLLLLEFLPDFLLVLSLKGAFLYVAPSVRLVLGYEPQDLVGRTISDVCHPADLVPLMRELKEGSVSGLNISGSGDVSTSVGMAPNLLPKSVDLLFRALPKVSKCSRSKGADTTVEQGNFHSPGSSETSCPNNPSDESMPSYVWLECRGRLHVEPGKGRKAIILSARARWMPVVRWNTVEKIGVVGNIRSDGGNGRMAGSRLSGTTSTPSNNPLEFWALLSTQGTFLVASTNVRDVLGWGATEMIGRNIWAMVRDHRNGMRERVETELAKLDTPEVKEIVDPPPVILMTSLVHKKLHVVSLRLAFYRTPRSYRRAPPTASAVGFSSTPLIHPLNNPLCPIVCQATVLSSAEQQSENNITAGFDPSSGRALQQVLIQTDRGDKRDEPRHASSTSLFEELDTTRGTSWQYELQQLKFANQRLHEELQALESACVSSGTRTGPSSSTTGTGHIATIPLVQQCPSSSSTEIPIPQPPQYTSSMHSTLSTSISSLRLPNSLHEQDPPSSEWSSLAGANGQGPNPLKRPWYSEGGPTT